MSKKPTLVVLEGLDGSGKATQAVALEQRLRQQGVAVRRVSFPDYNSESSALVRMYLAGEVGTLREVNPFAASSFYSLDRYISFTRDWKKDYTDGVMILADRYTTSNMTHQMGKLPREQWQQYLDWLRGYEYELLGLPAPSLVVYLDMLPEASRRLVEKRYHGDENKKDLHERDAAYLAACREAALFAAAQCGWRRLRCCRGPEQDYALRPVEDVTQAIWDEMQEAGLL